MFSKVFLILAALTVIAMSAPLLSDTEEWETFKKTHNKNYGSPEEEQKRFQIFKDNLQQIREHNANYDKGIVTYTKGINQFADLTQAEFKQQHTGLLRPKP